MIRACAFDLGNTLSNDTLLYDRALGELAAWLVERRAVGDPEQFVRAFDRVNRETQFPYVSHTYGEPEMFRSAFDELGIVTVAPGVSPEAAMEHYRGLVRRHTVLEGEIREALAWVREHDLRLALLSNERAARVDAWFDATGARELFDVVFVSEREEVEKPDPRYFSGALARIGVAPGELLMFGDNPIADGACRRSGVRFVHVTAYCSDRWYFERGDANEPDDVLEAITAAAVQSCIMRMDRRRPSQ